MPQPHDIFHNEQAREYDGMSAQDRLDQIAADLTPDERTTLEAFVLLCSGGKQGCLDILITYKFREGQSSFARHFFHEASRTGRLSYSFSTPLQSIENSSNGVAAVTKAGAAFSASRIICTVPLNVLSTIKFDPPLAHGKQKAISIGHVNQCVKVHAEIKDKDMRSWSGITHPHNKLVYAIGDGTTPSGNTHIVCFGAAQNHIQAEEDVDQTIAAVQGLAPEIRDIQRLVFHNWAKDEYAKGAWFFSPPGLLTSHLDDMRARHSNVLFANSDWALGWRSFIDGAIEEGTRAAAAVLSELLGECQSQVARPNL